MFAMLMGLRSISPAELHALLPSRTVTVIDVNDPVRWRAARVPGAINRSPVALTVADLPPDPSTPLVFYCSGYLCRKAPNAAKRAQALGYSDVRVMSAGIDGWLSAKLPTASGTDATAG